MPDFNFTSQQNLTDIIVRMPRMTSKRFSAAASTLTTGLSPVTAFTVVGPVLMRIFGMVTTGLTSTGATGTLAVGVTGATGALIAATTADGSNFPTGAVWAGDTAPTVKAKVLSASSLAWVAVNNTNVIVTVATNSMTAGDISLFCQYILLDSTATVTAA